MACSGCPGASHTKQTRTNAFSSVMAAPRPMAQAAIDMQDDQFVMVRYTTPRRGGHPVIGTTAINPATGQRYNYGDRRAGDKFLMHRDDVYMTDRAGQQVPRNPALYQPIEEKAATPPPAPPKETPPPEPIAQSAPAEVIEEILKQAEDQSDWGKVAVDAAIEAMTELPDEESDTSKVVVIRTDDGISREERTAALDVLDQYQKENPPINFQTLPGVTAAIAAELEMLGLQTRSDVLKFGVEGLMTVKGIGEKKAQKIVEWLSRKGD